MMVTALAALGGGSFLLVFKKVKRARLLLLRSVIQLRREFTTYEGFNGFGQNKICVLAN
jgi:hypothetical protein